MPISLSSVWPNDAGLGRIMLMQIGAQKAALIAEAAPIFQPPIVSPSWRITASWI